MDCWQDQVKHLEKFFEDKKDNVSNIIQIYYNVVRKGGAIEKVNYGDPSVIIQFLNKNAILLLSPEVVEIFKKNRLEAYSYLLVANNMLNLEDVKDDLLNGDVLANATPPNTIRKLKRDLSLATDVVVQVTAAVKPETPPQSSNEQEQSMDCTEADKPTENNQRESEAPEDINRLTIKIKNQCTETRDVDGVTLYKLKLNQVSTCTGSSSIVKRFSFGDPADILNSRTCKTILLVGATGSGKTTMINAMINYVLGVEWDDPFRFILVDEEIVGASQAHSQTQGVTAYDIHYRDGFRIPFSLTIVDTPGFGDTSGMERDKEITAAIQEFFKHQNGIQELDAVGFVVQSALARLTSSQIYIFNSVLSIFGKDIKDNIGFLVTFSDGRQPSVFEAIKEAELPCRLDSKGEPCHQKFNNSAIYANNKDDDEMSPIQWKNAMKNFKLFFEEMNKLPTKSLQMTNEVLEDRKQLEIYLDFMFGGIDKQLMKIEELRKTQELVALNKEKVNANQDFEMKVPVSKKAKVSVDGNMSAMNCTKCETTCHYPCQPSFWTGFCPAFWRSEEIISSNETSASFLKNPIASALNAITETAVKAAKNIVSPKCKICPGRCSNGDHINEKTRWTLIQVEEIRTFYDVRNNYEDAMQEKMNAESMVKALETEVEQLKEETLKNMNCITYLQNKLKTIALHGNPLSTFDYIQIMIDNEERDQKPGYRERIKNLKELLELAKFNRNAIDDDEKFAEQFTSFNSP